MEGSAVDFLKMSMSAYTASPQLLWKYLNHAFDLWNSGWKLFIVLPVN